MTQKRPRVAMLISNGYGPDVRVQKEAHTLALAGYRVTVIAWDRERRFPVHEVESVPAPLTAALAEWPGRTAGDPERVAVVRIHVPAGYRTGRRLLRSLPSFWWRAFQELRRARPCVVHAHDLDTVPVAFLYGRLAQVPVVYDAREYYPGMVQANVGERASRALDQLDHWLTPRVDAVIAVGERLAARYRAMGGRVWVVNNSQPLRNDHATEQTGKQFRQTLGVPEDALLAVYVGYLTPDRYLDPVLKAVPRLEQVWLAVGGTGPQLERVQQAAASCERIRVLGWVPLEQVAAVVASADVVYYGLDARNSNSLYFVPNLAFFALGAGRPILTTPVGEIADVVKQNQCGVVMSAATPEAAERALVQLCDKAYHATLANHARYAGRTAYNWSCAATQLLDAYRYLATVRNCL
jgi:glycosyltransferase involved in cell wall biosynthesis